MTMVLKFGLSLLFFLFSLLTFLYPEIIKDYVEIRFQGFYQFALAKSAIASYISRNAARNIPLSSYKGLAAFLAMGGAAIILERRMVILAFAYIVMSIGGALHMPYTTDYLKRHTMSQIKRLLAIFGVFCGLLVLANSSQTSNEVAKGI